MIDATYIYETARKRALRDHKRMVRKFMRGEIPIASPCGMDRERQYIIDDFDEALQKAFASAARSRS